MGASAGTSVAAWSSAGASAGTSVAPSAGTSAVAVGTASVVASGFAPREVMMVATIASTMNTAAPIFVILAIFAS
ncbi:MAG: hypothetical protein GX647_05090 [Clostridiales bacterium]|nr:hypothetical protein [Clostridiales bacterium]